MFGIISGSLFWGSFLRGHLAQLDEEDSTGEPSSHWKLFVGLGSEHVASPMTSAHHEYVSLSVFLGQLARSVTLVFGVSQLKESVFVPQVGSSPMISGQNASVPFV